MAAGCGYTSTTVRKRVAPCSCRLPCFPCNCRAEQIESRGQHARSLDDDVHAAIHGCVFMLAIRGTDQWSPSDPGPGSHVYTIDRLLLPAGHVGKFRVARDDEGFGVHQVLPVHVCMDDASVARNPRHVQDIRSKLRGHVELPSRQ
jgi:hypothetical protein